MGKKIEEHHVVTGKKGIILLNVLSRLIVCLGVFTLVCAIIVGVRGAIDLSNAGDEYVEFVKSENFEFPLSAVDLTADEFITMTEENEKASPLTIYILSIFGQVISLVFLLTVYMCAWVVTGAIKKDENNPFTLENLKALKKCATTLVALFVLAIFSELLIFFIFDVDMVINVGLAYIFIVCLFIYLFDAGCKLQEANEKKQ